MSTMTVNQSTAVLAHRCRRSCSPIYVGFYDIVFIDIILFHAGEKVPI
jgi:hypothetical protein